MFNANTNEFLRNTDDLSGWIHPAVVINNNDPEQTQRVQCRVSGLHKGVGDPHLPWAKCVGLAPGNVAGIGTVNVPPVGARGWVYFPESDEHHLYYMGTDNFPDTKLAELLVDYPNTYGSIDAAGNLFMVNTTQKTWTLNLSSGSYLQFSPSGATLVVAGDFLVKATGEIALDAGGAVYINGTSINTNVTNAATSLTTKPRTAPIAATPGGQTGY